MLLVFMVRMDDHAPVGDTDRAFEWLGKAFQERPAEMISFGVSPEMDPGTNAQLSF